MGLKYRPRARGGAGLWPYREHGLLTYKQEEGLTAAGFQDIQVRDRTGWRACERAIDAYVRR